MRSWGTFYPTTATDTTGTYQPPPKPPKIPDGDWRLIANGRVSKLTIDNGKITGGPTGQITKSKYEVVKGRRGEGYKVTFTRSLYIDGQDDVIQDFVGYMFYSDTTTEGQPSDHEYRMAGTYTQREVKDDGHSGGWYATASRIADK